MSISETAAIITTICAVLTTMVTLPLMLYRLCQIRNIMEEGGKESPRRQTWP